MTTAGGWIYAAGALVQPVKRIRSILVFRISPVFFRIRFFFLRGEIGIDAVAEKLIEAAIKRLMLLNGFGHNL